MVCQIPWYKRASMREGTVGLDVFERTDAILVTGQSTGEKSQGTKKSKLFFVCFCLLEDGFLCFLAFLGGHHEGFWFPSIATALQGFLFLISRKSKPWERKAGTIRVFPIICPLVELFPLGSLNIQEDHNRENLRFFYWIAQRKTKLEFWILWHLS